MLTFRVLILKTEVMLPTVGIQAHESKEIRGRDLFLRIHMNIQEEGTRFDVSSTNRFPVAEEAGKIKQIRTQVHRNGATEHGEIPSIFNKPFPRTL